MNPDLVRPAGSRYSLDQAGLSKPLQHPEGGFGGQSFCIIHHTSVAMPYIDSKWMPGSVFIPFRIARTNGMVNLLHLMMLKLHVQFPMGFRCPGKNHHPACDFIQAVNNPKPSVILFKQLDQIGRIPVPSIRQDRDLLRVY